MTWGKERSKFWPYQGKRDDTEVGMHGDVGSAGSGDNGVEGMRQVISISPYATLRSFREVDERGRSATKELRIE